MKEGEPQNVVSLDAHREKESAHPVARMSAKELADYQIEVMLKHEELTAALAETKKEMRLIRFRFTQMELDDE